MSLNKLNMIDNSRVDVISTAQTELNSQTVARSRVTVIITKIIL